MCVFFIVRIYIDCIRETRFAKRERFLYPLERTPTMYCSYIANIYTDAFSEFVLTTNYQIIKIAIILLHV